jgi:hypothetical protein
MTICTNLAWGLFVFKEQFGKDAVVLGEQAKLHRHLGTAGLAPAGPTQGESEK